jgi:hypothetical protein
MKQYQNTFALVLFSLFSIALSQSVFPPLQSSSYQLAAMNNSGMAGTMYIADYGAENTFIVVNVLNADTILSYPAHIHEGNCGSNGEVAVPLEDVKGSRGLSVTLTDAPYTDLVSGGFYINVHHPEDINFILLTWRFFKGIVGQIVLRSLNFCPCRPCHLTLMPAKPIPI